MKNSPKFFKVSYVGFSALFGALSILNNKYDWKIIFEVISYKVSGYIGGEQIDRVTVKKLKLKIFLILDKIDDINKYG